MLGLQWMVTPPKEFRHLRELMAGMLCHGIATRE